MSKKKVTPQQIRETLKSGSHVDIPLVTSQKILSRITDGIYRQPASALRELISNAYDADATRVTITTDAPRFGEISVRDNGIGISPENLKHLIDNIGGSAKRTNVGTKLDIASTDPDYSKKGRKFIGKMGIGLFAVAQFTRHFLIITQCKGDGFKTIADVTLGNLDRDRNPDNENEIMSGEARVWTEVTSNTNAHGTEIKLLDLLPRTRAELCSFDRWSRIDFEIEDEGKPITDPPDFHIGRVDEKNTSELIEQPSLPWKISDSPQDRFESFVYSVRKLAKTESELVDLDKVCDNYLQMLWTLSLSCPLDYLGYHPFDLPKGTSTLFYELENKIRGQASELGLTKGQTPRKKLGLSSPKRPDGDRFEVTIDRVRLARPIVFTKQPKTANAIKTPLMFIGRCSESFQGKPPSLSGGPLAFEAYLFWTPKVLPKQHQGVMLRVGNASGATFDSTFMGYQVSEQTRLRQITAEIFVHTGLDGAINLDRETFNFAHPHYQFLVKWLHSAIRQVTNKNKAVGKSIRDRSRAEASSKAKQAVENLVTEKLANVGVDDVAEVSLVNSDSQTDLSEIRDEGALVLDKSYVLPEQTNKRKTGVAKQKSEMRERKAVALAQLLYGWGLFDDLTFEEQQTLVRDILELVLLEEGR
jgi:hypothetical protein